MSTPHARLAVDVGGTFTDVVLEASGHQHATKILTTPDAPERAILDGAAMVLAEARLAFSDVAVLLHGTTLATNAIIERKGARCALIATEGFRDVIEIADESRFDQYDLMIDRPNPLVPRRLRFTVPERLDVMGKVRLPLDEAAVRAIVPKLREARIQAVAVAFLHSYVDDRHEARVRTMLGELCPEISVTLSSEVCPEVREWERTTTAIANAYVQPLMSGYLGRLAEALAGKGYRRPIHLMTSGGGLADLETARRFPVRLIESGPAGGAILSAHVAAERAERRVVSFDMGGTTAKICLIRDFEPMTSRVFEVDRASRFMKGSGLPVRIPVIEMVEIGAGGGSIARVDGLRRITVGPDSAGSVPGPACYDRGGADATVTDADVVLGRVDVSGFAGGKLTLAPAKAENAVAASVGRPLDLAPQLAAHGIAEIVDENMANAARVHAIERGAVIGEHTLIAFGGAAPLHACRLAEKIGIDRIIVPAGAGVGSAIGFLAAPAAYELIRSRFMRLSELDHGAANALLREMSEEATRLAEAAALGRALSEERAAFMRYSGQGHEVAVALPVRPFAVGDEQSLRELFEAEYRRQFERHIPGAEIEILSWSIRVGTGRAAPKALARHGAARSSSARASGVQKVYEARSGAFQSVPTYRRADLRAGEQVAGPALILESGTSTFVSTAFTAHLDAGSALVLERRMT